jgi:hypothetical protein
MGSAIECFDDASAVVVPRSRFAPVKTCNDLFALRSGGWLRWAGQGSAGLARPHLLPGWPVRHPAHSRTLSHCTPADAYKVTEESTVVLVAPSPPLIKLDDKHYK